MIPAIVFGSIILVLLITIGVPYILYEVNKKKAKESVLYSLSRITGHQNDIKVEKNNKAFDFELDYDEKKYLVKVVYHNSTDEINVNAREYWQNNHGAVSSRTKGTKLEGVYDLINYNLVANGYDESTKKVYVIYPFSKNLMKVINECEMEFIYPHSDIYGTHLINFTELESKFDEI